MTHYESNERNIIKVYQVKASLVKESNEAGNTDENEDLRQFFLVHYLKDDIELPTDYYEITNLITLSTSVSMNPLEIGEHIFRELNVGDLRDTHTSYSLSVNDVLEINGSYYRVAGSGFKPLPEWDELKPDIPFSPAYKQFLATQNLQLSIQTSELRNHQDIEFDVFVMQTKDGDHTFFEDFTNGGWDENSLSKEDITNGQMHPAYTNVSPFHLRQDETYLITYIDSKGVHHVFTDLTVQDVAFWLENEDNKIAYKDSYASIYLQSKCLSLSAYKAFVELH